MQPLANVVLCTASIMPHSQSWVAVRQDKRDHCTPSVMFVIYNTDLELQ